MKYLTLENTTGLILVSDEDFEFLSKFKWHLYDIGYPVTIVDREQVYLHILLLGTKLGFQIDHKDLNKLNNQRENLRWATKSQNLANRKSVAGTSSKFKGVNWSKHQKSWRATITFKNRQTHLGWFKCETEAALAYDKAAKEKFGEFARTNF